MQRTLFEQVEARLLLAGGPLASPPVGPPEVGAVYVANSHWSQSFKNQLASNGQGSAQYGFAIPTGSGQSTVLAWSGLDQVSIGFTEPVSVVKDDLVIRGQRVPQYAIDSFSYDPGSNTATWTLQSGQAFTNDQLLLDLDADGYQSVYDSGGFESPRFVSSNLEGNDAPLSGQGPWVRTGNPGVGVVENSNAATGSQAVSITRTGADERWAVQENIRNVSAPILVQWDEYVKQTVFPLPGSFGPYFAVESYDGLGNAPLLAGSAGVDAATGEVLYQQAGTGYLVSTGQTVSFNSWHHFDMVLDYATHTYSVYVDGAGTPIVNGEGFVDHSGAHPINDFTDAPLAALAASFDPASQQANGQAYFDNYKIGLTPPPVNNSGLALDGEWINGVSNFPSGDGTAGGDFRFTTYALAGDANGDGVVNFPDLVILAQHYGQSTSGTAQGDFTADNMTDFPDLVVLAQNYNAALPGVTASAAAAAPVISASAVAPVLQKKAPAKKPIFNTSPEIHRPVAAKKPTASASKTRR